MNPRKYLSIAKNSMMTNITYRIHFIFMALTNVIYIILIYFFWQAVYEGQAVLNGMTFNQAFTWLALSGSFFIMFQTWTDWNIARRILSGDIIMDLFKPLSIFWQRLCMAMGQAGSQCITITIPAVLIIVFVFGAAIPFGINILFFPLSILAAFFLSTTIDFMIGLTAFYTESIWGIYATKEAIVLFLSGGLIPLPFFPEPMRTIIGLLPFQAIYAIPMTILTSPVLGPIEYFRLLALQAGWCVALYCVAMLFFRRAMRVLTVNGG